MEKMKTLDEIIVSFFDSATAEGFDMKPRGSLLSPYFQNEFNLSAAHQYVDPILSSLKELAPQKIVINEPCFRRIDIEKIGYSPYHLLLFEMGVIGILGHTLKKSEWLKKILQLSREYLGKIGFKIDRLIFTISEGMEIFGKDFEKDENSYNSLRNAGILDKNIMWVKGRRNFIYRSENNCPAGYCIEIFYPVRNTLVEIATLVMYTHIYKEGTLLEAKNIAVGCAFGFERISYVLNSYESVFEIDTFRPFMDFVCKFLGAKLELSLFKQRLQMIGELLRALTFLIGEGQLPDQSGRGKIIKRLARLLFSEINYLSFPLEETVIGGVNTFIEVYSKRYSHLGEKKDLVVNTILSLKPEEKE